MVDSLTVSIHQPNYLPWLGYFYKIWASDVFVFLDDVQYARRSPTSRTQISSKQNMGARSYLSIPLHSPQYFDRICELKLNQTQAWRRKHLETMRHIYSGAPFFKRYFLLIEEWVNDSKKFIKLAEFNIYLIAKILDLLGIQTACYSSSTLPVQGLKAGYIIALVKHIGGTTYLSGNGARKYQKEEDFHRAGIQLVYTGFGDSLVKHPYPQFPGTEFINGLSIVDALFNVGPEGVVRMFERYDKMNVLPQ